MPNDHGILRWLGRRFGFEHVVKAIKTDVTDPNKSEAAGKVVYRKDTVQELSHPADPELKLRRTIIDEVVKEPKPPEEK